MFFLFCSWFLLQIAFNAGECFTNCRNSTPSENSCYMCKKHVIHSLRRSICPVGCTSCFAYTLCYECVNGMYGKTCNKRCGTCRPDNQDVVKCEMYSGVCVDGCVDGYFGLRCDRVCKHCKPDNQGLVKCSYNSGTCTNGCVDGYYSPRCDRACEHCKPDNQGMVKCDYHSGACTSGCEDGYYGVRCHRLCGLCKPDNQGVLKCDSDTGACTNACEDGYFGSRCNRLCGHCKPGNQSVVKCDSDSGTCTNGCEDGYYSSRCDSVCSGTCSKRACSQQSGFCYNGCVLGWYGDTCNKTCSDTCSLSSCNQKSGFCDNGCVSGWHSDKCEESCSNTCYNKSCDQYTGYCVNGCVSGWYGDTCSEICSDTCSLNSCNQTSGFCEKGCVSGWHGDMCKLLCSSTCYNKSCDQYSGRCYNGCTTAYYGDTCEYNCIDTCKERVCNRETSQCLRGCEAGYQGAFCNMTMNIGPDSVVVGFTSSLAGVIILLVFASIIWFIRREVRGKHYGNPKVSSRDTSAPIYDDIPDNDDTTEVSRVSGSHLYMEVGTAHTPRGIHEYGPKKLNSSDTGISCNWAKTLAVFEAISDTPLVCAKALSMYTLHSEVSNYNNSDVIHTSSFVSLDNAEVHRKSSNLSRKYYEVPDKITGVNYNLTIERNHTNDDNEIPISSACPTAEIAEADGASLSGQCNTLADSTTSPTRDSKRTRNNDLISTRNNEIDVSDNNQTLQKAKEDKYNLRPPGFHIDMPLETHQTQENLYEEDSVTLNYIHPVN